jgi:hypothetical protein
MAAQNFEATTMGNLVGPEQLMEIRRQARRAGLDADEDSLTALRCRTEDLSRDGANVFIKHLITMQTSARAARRS